MKFDIYLKNPKWIIGFSDITVIHNKLNLFNSESIHAMMITGFDNIDQNNDSLSKLKNVLFGANLSYSIAPNNNNKVGKSEGTIVGGNLTLIQSTIGSKTELKVKDKILFIEEIGEYAYHIDRMLYSLKRAGYFENCKGLIVGQISDVKANTTDFGRSIDELILDILEEYKKKYSDKDNVPRPNHWSGWNLDPSSIEFWLDGDNRIHERLKYTLNRENTWTKNLLSP